MLVESLPVSSVLEVQLSEQCHWREVVCESNSLVAIKAFLDSSLVNTSYWIAYVLIGSSLSQIYKPHHLLLIESVVQIGGFSLIFLKSAYYFDSLLVLTLALVRQQDQRTLLLILCCVWARFSFSFGFDEITEVLPSVAAKVIACSINY